MQKSLIAREGSCCWHHTDVELDGNFYKFPVPNPSWEPGELVMLKDERDNVQSQPSGHERIVVCITKITDGIASAVKTTVSAAQHATHHTTNQATHKPTHQATGGEPLMWTCPAGHRYFDTDHCGYDGGCPICLVGDF